MKIGIDYRPALLDQGSRGRYARELVRALAALDDVPLELGLFGHTFAGRKIPLADLGLPLERAELSRLRLPAPVLAWLQARTGKGADDLVGGCALFHHTGSQLPDVRAAREVATVPNVIHTIGAGYMETQRAEARTERTREQVQRARRLLVPCQFVGAEIVMALGAHPGRITVTEFGCDHVARHLPDAATPRPSTPYLLTVARVDARKNHLRALTAFEALVREGHPHRWILVGRPGYQADFFREALAASPARERIEWREQVDEPELVRLYTQADVFLFPTLCEGDALQALESMACGTPVVTSCVAATGELCEGAAMMVEPTEPDEIFGAIQRVLTEDGLADDLITRGHERAAEKTWQRTALQTYAAYRGAMRADDGETPQLMRRL